METGIISQKKTWKLVLIEFKYNSKQKETFFFD